MSPDVESKPGEPATDGVDEFDVVVLGSGAAALTAALAAHNGGSSVAVLEKADRLGGTSAWSGGMVWIPNNPHMPEIGVPDSRDEALTYLGSLSQGLIEPTLAEAFVDAGPEMVRWVEAETPVKFQIIEGFPDYHPEQPGGKPGGGRSMECPLFPFDTLGEWADRVTVGPQYSGAIMISETPLGHGPPDGVPEAEAARRAEHDERGSGQALIGALLKGCLDRGVDLRTDARAVELVMDDRRVVGVVVETPAGRTTVQARQGVVLATGGFEWDPELVRSFIRGPLERSVSVPTNTGDGLKMAMRIGAALGNMREAWWAPTIDVPDDDGHVHSWMVNGERSRPHTIMVNRFGKRFTNEATNYNAFGAAFHNIDVTTAEYTNLPCWVVFDRFFLERYGLASYRVDQGEVPAWMIEAPTLSALAERLGIPDHAFEDTVERWNKHVADGEDPDFGRGRSAHDNWWGDSALTGPGRATLGPIDTPPFYAVEAHSGTLGTKGGPRTTPDAQVIDVDGDPIDGLYAAGNVMASAMGMTYGGAGGTLGPGMVFGYLAGRHIAGRPRR